MRKAFALACALFISFALLLLPSTEARALLQKGAAVPPPRCGRHSGGRYTPCIPPSPPSRCNPYIRKCHPPPNTPPPPKCDPLIQRRPCYPPAGPSGP
ncbi:hypothetical protein NL676_014704 [Syzygium grande]|nr:hypothetical protein NL676_014704 [Syzygium grande]